MGLGLITFLFCFMPKTSYASEADFIYDKDEQTLTDSYNKVIYNVTCNDQNELTIGDNTGRYTNMYLDLRGTVKSEDGSDDYTIVEIADSAFTNCTDIEYIEIGYSIKTIGNNAFNGCSGLIAVFFENEIAPSIGEGIFSDCTNLEEIYIPYSGLESYQEPLSEYSDFITYETKTLNVTNGVIVEDEKEVTKGSYGIGQEVVIKANEDTDELHFVCWQYISGPKSMIIKDVNARETILTMPAEDIYLTAVFEKHNFVDGECIECGYKDPNYSVAQDNDENNVNTENVNKDTKAVDTSDENNIGMYVGIMIFSAVAIGCLSIYKKKRA